MADTKDKFDFSENPFVGPHPIETGRNIFGRNREIDDLYYLLSAERIVMLHSPSGAGKTSLIQAGLIPRLNERFDVWGPTRVNQLPSANSAATVNRYIRSAVLGFEQQIPTERRRTEEQLADQFAEKTLTDYVTSRREESKNIVLIFDQFEEILTADPLAIDAKREFFKQLGELLLDPRIWALFAMREDYLPALDPYAEQVPTHLKNWFRLDLLRRDKATEAITETAKEGRRQFEPEAVEKLVTDLATMKVQQPDGTFVPQKGLYVEPLQLQVVCRRLWERMPVDKQTIDQAEIEQSGDVTTALADYYAAEVVRLADGDVRVERKLREWVGERLITPDGIRSQVLRGAGNSEGLDNELIASLVNTHLVRGEQREGATWYELAHDRLIEPIRNNNRDWFDIHLHRVQKLASLWEREGHPDGWLLPSEELTEAKQWAKENDIWLTPTEFRFLEASIAKQEAIEKEERQAKRLRKLLVALAALSLLAFGAAGYALLSYLESKYQQSVAQYQEKNALDKQSEAEQFAREANLQKTLAGVKQTEAEAAKLAEELKTEQLLVKEKDLQKSLGDSRGLLYVANQLLAWNAFAQNQYARVNDFLEASFPVSGSNSKEDTRSFDWYYLWRKIHNERQTLKGHADVVGCVSFSLNGRTLVSGSRDATVSLWGVTNGKKLRDLKLKNYSQSIISMSFSPDRQLLASGGADNTVRVYDVTNGNELWMRVGSHLSIWSVSFSPNGQMLASGGDDGIVTLWDVKSGSKIKKLEGPKLIINSMAFSPDGHMLAGGSDDGTISLWNIESGKVMQKLKALVTSVSFSPDGQMLAGGCYDHVIRLWDVHGNELPKLVGHVDRVTSVSFSPDGQMLVSGSFDKTVRLWNVQNGKELRKLEGHVDTVTGVSFSPDGHTLVSGSLDKTVKLWDVDANDEMLKLRGHIDPITSLSFSPDGRRLASGSVDNTVRIWEVESGNELRKLEGHEHFVSSVLFSPDGRTVVSGGDDRTIRLWEIESGKELRRLEGQVQSVSSVSFSPDGKKLAVGGYSNVIEIWNVESGKVLRKLDSQARSVNSVVFSPDGRILAASSNLLVRLWDVISGKELCKLEGHPDYVKSVVFSPDGRMLATSCSSSVKLWELKSGKELWNLEVQEDEYSSISLSPNGHTLAVACPKDAKVKLLDFKNGKELGELKGHEGEVTTVSFSPDGKTLASGGGGRKFVENGELTGEIFIWRGTTKDEAARQCIHCGRSFYSLLFR